MVTDIAEKETVVGFVDDDSQIAADPYRPEVLISSLVELMEIHTRIGRIQLQVKCRGLDGLLLFASQFGEAIGKCVGDTEIHISSLRQRLFILIKRRKIRK